MKHKGSRCDFTADRDNDLLRAYGEVEGAGADSMLALMARVVRMPSKRFWTSPERATHVMRQLFKGGSLSGMTAEKRNMYREIFRRVKKFLKACPDVPLSHAVERIIREPAPCFYLTPKSAYVLLYRAVAKRRRQGHYLRFT